MRPSPPRHRNTRWSPVLRAIFLDDLAQRGDVSRAAASCGLSRQSVYRLRGRDEAFARDWDEALARLQAEAAATQAAMLAEFERRALHRAEFTPLDPDNRINPVSTLPPGATFSAGAHSSPWTPTTV